MKVVINTKHGGFCLSDWVFEKLIERGWSVSSDPLDKDADILAVHSPKLEYVLGYKWKSFSKELRTNLDLIAVIEELGVEANGEFARLKVIEIPDSISWELEECDGEEWVAEIHRTWS